MGLVLVGVVLLSIFQIVKNQSLVRGRRKAIARVFDISNDLTRVLAKRRACTQTLGRGSEVAEGLPLGGVRDEEGRFVFEAKKVYEGVAVDSIKLVKLRLRGRRGRVNFEFVFRQLRDMKKIRREVPVHIEVDAEGKLLECGSWREPRADSLKEVCAGLDGVYDGFLRKCRLKNALSDSKCPPGHFVRGFKAGGLDCAKAGER